MLQSTVLPWVQRVTAAHVRPFCFQQEGAPAHTARATVAFLEEENVPFWTPTMWPPSSPDLNPLDYAVWSYVQQEACKNRPANLTVMKRLVSTAWNRIPPERIRGFCAGFCRCLERVVAAIKKRISEKCPLKKRY